MFNILSHSEKNNSEIKERLLETLKKCEGETLKGKRDADACLAKVKSSIQSAQSIITDCVSELDNNRYCTADVKRVVKDQLRKVSTEFYSIYNKACTDVDGKYNETRTFNITVFGRTEAGKSTLMEILTEGDGRSIGSGGQRTTRDVRSYKWNEMKVVDVPGIEAYGGDADDKLAEASAIYADLILFLVRTSNPGAEEAQWYKKLQKKDKPIICVFNVNQALHLTSEVLLERDLKKVANMESDEGTKEAIEQFKKFLGPNQRIDDVRVHLLSKFQSQRLSKENPTLSAELEKVSNFSKLNGKIINTVSCDAILYRRRGFLSIVDEPVFQQMSQLFLFSAMQYDQSAQVYDTFCQFRDWKDDFHKRMLPSVRERVTRVFDALRDQVQGFVEYHSEDEDASSEWNALVKRQRLEERLRKIMEDVESQCREEIQSRFSTLENQIKLSAKINQQTFFSYRGSGVTDFKNGWKIGTGILGVGAIIVACWWNPAGWIALGIGLIGGFFSWLCDSAEDKRSRQKAQMERNLTNSIYKMERNAQESMYNCYKESIFKMQNNAVEMLKSLSTTLLALTNSERQLALGLCRNHITLSQRLVGLILDDLGISQDKIHSVARIPAKRCCIVVRDRTEVDGRLVSRLGQKLGNGEEVRIVEYNPDAPLKERVRRLLNYFKVPTANCRIASVDNDRQTVIYIDKKNYTEQELDSILLIEQIVLTHIIPKSYGRD